MLVEGKLALDAALLVEYHDAEFERVRHPGEADGDQGADWRAIDVRGGADGSTFRIVGPGGVEECGSLRR